MPKQIALLFLACASTAYAADGLLMNYSLWPRRPEAVSKARSLIYQQKLDEALEELSPFISKRDIGGIEARKLTSLINLPRYLSLQNPHAKIYRVVSGDHVSRIASKSGTSLDLLYMLNGITNPSRLKVGEKLIVAPMDLTLYIDVAQQELRLWDKKTLVVAVPLSSIEGAPSHSESLKIAHRYAYTAGVRISIQSPAYTSSNRVLVFSDGSILAGVETVSTNAACYRMDQRTLNAIALLLNIGTTVRVLTGKNAATVTTAAASFESPYSLEISPK